MISSIRFSCVLPPKSSYALLFSSVQLLSHVRLFATPWTAACQASLSIISSQSLLKFMSIELVDIQQSHLIQPSNHLILCCPLLLPPSIFLSIRVFSNESVLCIKWPKYWHFSFSIRYICICLFKLVFSFYSDNYPEVELPDCIVVLFLTFQRLSILFTPTYIHTNSAQEFRFLHILANTCLLSSF